MHVADPNQRSPLHRARRQHEDESSLLQKAGYPLQAGRPLRVATIGDDPLSARLVEAVERSERFELVARFPSPDAASASGAADAAADPWQTSAPLSGQRWEALLADDLADVVVVARRPHEERAAEHRAEQLKRLVQIGVPLIAVHPVCDMLLAYELDMHRQDQQGPIFPYCPAAHHPLLEPLSAAIRLNKLEIGEVEQIVCERTVASDQRDKLAVLDQLAGDAFVIGQLLGDVRSVSAAGVSKEQPTWRNLTVHFASAGTLIARWSLAPQRDAAGLRVTLIGGAETASLWLPDEPGEAEASAPELVAREENTAPEPSQAASADGFLRRVADVLEANGPWNGVNWESVCRSLEVTDAVERSVARQRTIELYHESVTEQETFKSMMAAGGCAMLCWVLFCLLAVGMVEGLQLPIRHAPLWRFWPAVMFAPLAVFLALQLLQLAFPAKGAE